MMPCEVIVYLTIANRLEWAGYYLSTVTVVAYIINHQ